MEVCFHTSFRSCELNSGHQAWKHAFYLIRHHLSGPMTREEETDPGHCQELGLALFGALEYLWKLAKVIFLFMTLKGGR